ncbi:MAG: ring-1,2-phenylacetyl-CoA epoxidase subunit PaaE [Flavobacteriales bacterium]|jgi:ring-1,2-phenylacetyl-CoA epoxidase subunit PaaE
MKINNVNTLNIQTHNLHIIFKFLGVIFLRYFSIQSLFLGKKDMAFFTLPINDIVKETQDTVSIALKVPSSLKSDFEFKAGQYLTVKTHIDGKAVQRSYSISSSPSQTDELTIAVKKVTGGLMSSHLVDNGNSLGSIESMIPMGMFHLNEEHTKNHLLLISAGSGITPMLSIIKNELEQSPNRTITLIYGNRSEQEIIYKNKLQRLSDANENFNLIHVLEASSDLTEYTGMPTRDMLTHIIDEHNIDLKQSIACICGPLPMMQAAEQLLKDRGVDKSDILVEYFQAPVAESTIGSGKIGANIHVILDGTKTDIEMDTDKFILDAVLDAGIDAPYSCMGGICASCKAKKIKGEVIMENAYGISDDAIADGYILTCCSKPISDDVVIDYDA